MPLALGDFYALDDFDRAFSSMVTRFDRWSRGWFNPPPARCRADRSFNPVDYWPKSSLNF